MSPETPNITPVIRLIRIKDRPAAKAPPARSLAQLPPIARAKSTWRFPITPQPICSKTPPVVTNTPKLGLIIGSDLPILIIRPAAGITATTTIKALPNFCQNSKLKMFLNEFFIIQTSFFFTNFYMKSFALHTTILSLFLIL